MICYIVYIIFLFFFRFVDVLIGRLSLFCRVVRLRGKIMFSQGVELVFSQFFFFIFFVCQDKGFYFFFCDEEIQVFLWRLNMFLRLIGYCYGVFQFRFFKKILEKLGMGEIQGIRKGGWKFLGVSFFSIGFWEFWVGLIEVVFLLGKEV